MLEKYDVALSYSIKDNEIAKTIVDALRKRGVRVFFDEYYQPAGFEWHEHLRTVYEGSRLCVVILSEDYNNSEWSLAELRSLLAHSRANESYTIIPIKTSQTPIPDILKKTQIIDYNISSPEMIAEIIEQHLLALPSEHKRKPTQHFHVISRDSSWSVKRQGSSRAASIHGTQEEAVEEARSLAARNVPAEVVIHEPDGTISSREQITKK